MRTIFRIRSKSTVFHKPLIMPQVWKNSSLSTGFWRMYSEMSFRLERSLRLEDIFAESNLFLLFFVHLQLEGVFPVVHHFLPDFIVRISSFGTEVAAIEAGVEAVLPVFVGNLLKQGLPAVFPLAMDHSSTSFISFRSDWLFRRLYLSFSKFKWIN